MIRYLIKNNFKLMLRSKWIIVIMVLGPFFVISILSSAFGDLMKSYEKSDEITVGYSLFTDLTKPSESSFVMTEKEFSQVIEEGKKQDIIFVEFSEGDPEELIRKNNLSAFVTFDKAGYTLYLCDDKQVEGLTLEYFLGKVMDSISLSVLKTVVPSLSDNSLTLPVKKLKFLPAVNAANYYAIVMIVFFIWCGSLCLTAILAGEKKNRIEQRFGLSGLSGLRLFLAKWLPAVLMTTAETAVTLLFLSLTMNIEWGTSLLTLLILFLSVVASSAYGLMLYYIFHNQAVMVILLFSTVWTMGFLGGAFETYMFSSFSEQVKAISPLYYVNRSLVELSCMGESSYAGKCILILCGFIIICPLISVLTDHLRRRVNE